MATCYTELPQHLGERNLARQLINSDDPGLHLWFSANTLPGVNDVDVLLWHDQVGVFVIEVKAVFLDMVESFGYDKCTIRYSEEDRSEGRSPQRQAAQANESLRRHLASNFVGQLPFITPTVCWPLISRDQWNRAKRDDSRITGDFAKTMLFEEDITGGPQTLIERLRFIRKHPPHGAGTASAFNPKPEDLEKLKSALTMKANCLAAPSDLKRLQIIEGGVRNETMHEVPPGSGERILYKGYPGTGKTFRLLQVGALHAKKGYRVLFCCFNKVLAADISRILSYSKELSLAKGTLEVRDVFDILRTYAKNKGIHITRDQDHDTWGALLVDDMRDHPELLQTYDTILIDEVSLSMRNGPL